MNRTSNPLSHEVVRASAGSGKTYQLTTRYLQLLSRGESPQHVLATTFTRKAAGEVLARVLGRLAGACADEAQRDELGQALMAGPLTRDACLGMLRSLIDVLNRLSVGTIDGFFNRAAKALAIELGLPTDPRLIDERSPLATQMRYDAIHAVLGEKAAGDGGMATLIEMLRRLHHNTAQRSVTEAIDRIVVQLDEVYRAYPDRALWDRLPETGLLTREHLDIAIHSLEAMREQVPYKKGTSEPYASFLKRYEELLQHAYASRWDAVYTNGLVQKVIEDKDEYSRAPISEDWHQAIKPLAIHARAFRLKAIADQTRATHDLLALFHRHYKANRFAHRTLLFSDLTHLLAEGLPQMGESGLDALCYRLDARVTHLLLDEFQDTSLRQWDVLRPFAEQIAATSDGSRSLYCVGDTKQAIYGWRGGCAELFDEVQSLSGVESLSLSKSWRSSQVVLDSVNRVFGSLGQNAAMEKCRQAAVDWQQGFEPHEAIKQSLPGHVVLRTTAPKEPGSSDDEDASAPPDAHADYVACYIHKLQQTMPGRSIGVLMRSRGKARVLLHALRSLGVYAAEEGGNPITHTPAVTAVLAAIQLADHPGDSVARFHVMNSPIAEVVGLSGSVSEQALQQFSTALRRSLIDRGYAAVIGEWIRQVAQSCDATSLRRLMQLVEIAERFDTEDSTLRPGMFVDAVRAERVDDPSAASVRVMTIHGSKGLEFDCVVLPELDSTLSTHDKSDLVVLHRESPIAPVRAIYRRQDQKNQQLVDELQQAHDQQAYEKRTEDLCLLYVAMTRARHALHMLVQPLKERGEKKEPTSVGLTNLSYAAVLRQALAGDAEEGFDGDERLCEMGDADWSRGDVVAEPEMAAAAISPPDVITPIEWPHPQHAERSWVATAPSELSRQGRVSVGDLLGRTDPGGRDYGTLMHGLLAAVGFVDEAIPGEEELRGVASALSGDAELIAKAVASCQRAIAEPDVNQLLRRSGADELWRERRFVARIDDRLVNGIFDRVHLWWRDGAPERALIIDFKTDRVDDESIGRVVASYAPQLDLYRRALAQLINLPLDQIQAKLCFVGDGRVAEVAA